MATRCTVRTAGQTTRQRSQRRDAASASTPRAAGDADRFSGEATGHWEIAGREHQRGDGRAERDECDHSQTPRGLSRLSAARPLRSPRPTPTPASWSTSSNSAGRGDHLRGFDLMTGEREREGHPDRDKARGYTPLPNTSPAISSSTPAMPNTTAPRRPSALAADAASTTTSACRGGGCADGGSPSDE